MLSFLVSYDLESDTSRERYVRIAQAMQSRGARRVLLSQWAMRGLSAQAVFNAVGDLFTPADRLLVSPLDGFVYHNLLS